MTDPAIPDEWTKMADRVSEFFAKKVQEKMTSAASAKFLEMMLFVQLYEGLLPEDLAIKWANDGFVIASDALLKLYADMVKHGEQPSAALAAFVVEALDHGRITRGSGHYWYDDRLRNLGIATLVRFACTEFHLKPDRGKEQKKPRPSASLIVSMALKRHDIGMDMDEVRVARIWRMYQDDVSARLIDYLTGHSDFSSAP
jgi:hypothetical protein